MSYRVLLRLLDVACCSSPSRGRGAGRYGRVMFLGTVSSAIPRIRGPPRRGQPEISHGPGSQRPGRLQHRPAPRMTYPGSTMPWAPPRPPMSPCTPGACLRIQNMDDIFTVARRAGIKSVFAGGAGNYSALDTADFTYYGGLADTTVVQRGLDHLRKDGVRLIRLHLQQIRRGWTGPEDKTVAGSSYQRAILHADSLLGVFIAAFKATGVWDSTYVIVSSDHGMGTTSQSDHAPSQAHPAAVMIFYGPGVKKARPSPTPKRRISRSWSPISSSPAPQGPSRPHDGGRAKRHHGRSSRTSSWAALARSTTRR